MALIQCPECQHQVSEKAPACPNCGAPIVTPLSAPAPTPATKGEGRRVPHAFWATLGVIIIGAIGYFQSSIFREQNLPPIPIEVSYREALLGPGLVCIVENTSDRHLSVLATFMNPSLNQEKNFRLDVPPKGVTEVGHLEGWILASGDTIVLSHNDYKSWNGKIP